MQAPETFHSDIGAKVLQIFFRQFLLKFLPHLREPVFGLLRLQCPHFGGMRVAASEST